MKRFLPVMLIIVLSSIPLAACASGNAQGFVALPDSVKLPIMALVVAGVSFVFAKLVTLVPFFKFLEPYREPLALGLAAVLIDTIQNAVPDAYGQIAILAIQLLLAILAVLGVGNVLKARGVKAFR